MANSLNIQQDFNQIACLQLTLPNLASAPSSPVEGEEYYNTVSKIAYFYNGTSWVAMSGGGGGSSAFNDITSGTNTTAAMVVGSGASLATTGTGTIAASSVTGLSVASGKTLTSSNTLTLAGTDSSTLDIGAGGTLGTAAFLDATTAATASKVVERDSSANAKANSFFEGFTLVAASGSTITLTASTAPNYVVTGSGGQVIQLPNATTLPQEADIFSFNNNQSSGAITVNNASGTLIASIPSGGYITLSLLDNSTSDGTWDRHDQAPANVSWSTNTLDYAGSITSATWNGNTVQVNRGGTGAATLTGIVKGNGTSAFSVAVAGTDYQAALTNPVTASTSSPSSNTFAIFNGTGDQVAATSATSTTALLNSFVGDSGSGGTKGLVPAPSAGDAAAEKYLKADGTWATVSGGGSTLVLDETPSGTINGSNVTFTLASSPSSTVELTMYDSTNGGGIPLLYGVDYTVTGSTITMTAAPLTGSTLRANYGTGAVAAGLTLLGDVTGSGTSSITTTIRNDVDLPGSPTTTTQSVGDNSTKIATTAYVDNYAIPTGTIVTAFDSEDSFMVSKGFLKCDQTLRTVSQATYANLYAKIGLLNPIGSDFSIPATVTGNMTSIAASDSVYVYCSGTSIYSTTDLITWTSRTSNATGSLLSGWYQGSLFCFVGASGNIITSSDGSTWALRTSGTANQLNRIRYYNSLWLTVGASGTFLTASDPTASWTPRSTGSALNLNGVAYGNGIYVLTSSTGQSIITSPDLSTFTTRSIALQLGTSVLTDIYFANGIFVATGNNGTILTSTNGINWVRRLAFTVGNNLAILWSSARSCFVIAVNGEPSALISADGIRWQQVYVPYVVGVFSIAINSTKMVIGNGSYPIVCSVSYPYDNTTLFQLPIMSTRLPFNCGTPINYYIKT